MKADAFRYACGDGGSPEIALLGYVDKYGAMAGRVLSAREVRCMTVANNIVNAYRARAQAQNWAAWAIENKEAAELLSEAERLANG